MLDFKLEIYTNHHNFYYDQNIVGTEAEILSMLSL